MLDALRPRGCTKAYLDIYGGADTPRDRCQAHDMFGVPPSPSDSDPMILHFE